MISYLHSREATAQRNVSVHCGPPQWGQVSCVTPIPSAPDGVVFRSMRYWRLQDPHRATKTQASPWASHCMISSSLRFPQKGHSIAASLA
jgi:hypothetical protein